MPNTESRRLLKYLQTRRAGMVRLLRTLVEIESPTTDPMAVARVARVLAKEWKRHGGRGAKVKLLAQKNAGPIFRAEITLGTGRPKGQLLCLGHMDTVYPIGHIRRAPFRMTGGRAYGPGTFDMKCGIVQALYAVDAMREFGWTSAKKLVLLFTSDEETGSAAGRAPLEREAKKSDAVFVLEPAHGPRGALKTARKGVGDIELIVHGRAAHSGIEPEKGVNAIHELARQIQRIESWARPARGLTINADLVAGGSRTNVIAERASATFDLRLPRIADGVRVEKQFRSLQPFDRRAKLELRGGVNRPPFERTAGVAQLFRQAEAAAKDLGFTVTEASTGGGSDGNFTGALGIPTLDGLGGVGAGAHTAGEYVVVKEIPRRAALLAALLARC